MRAADVVYQWLFDVSPFLPVVVLSAIIMGAVYAVRRWAPNVWIRLEAIIPEGTDDTVAHVLLGLPSVIAGAAFGAVSSGADPTRSVLGAIAGALAPVFHHFLRALPIEYQGPVRDAVWKAWRDVHGRG